MKAMRGRICEFYGCKNNAQGFGGFLFFLNCFMRSRSVMALQMGIKKISPTADARERLKVVISLSIYLKSSCRYAVFFEVFIDDVKWEVIGIIIRWTPEVYGMSISIQDFFHITLAMLNCMSIMALYLAQWNWIVRT